MGGGKHSIHLLHHLAAPHNSVLNSSVACMNLINKTEVLASGELDNCITSPGLGRSSFMWKVSCVAHLLGHLS